MKYPKINKQPRREVNIPQFSGGINLRDGLSGIRDNQMTDCVNMWFKNGMLKTRPSFYCNKDMKGPIIGNADYTIGGIKVHSEISNNGAVFVSLKVNVFDGTKIEFWWQKDNAAFDMSEISKQGDCNFFLTEKDGVIYCYVSDYSIYTLNYKNGEKVWQLLSDADYYIPTVITHCKATNNGLEYTGTMLEGYNMLTESYKMVYSMVNLADVKDDVTPMKYALLKELPLNKDVIVKACVTSQNGVTEEHIVTFCENKTCYEQVDTVPKDNMYLAVSTKYIFFTSEKNSNTPLKLKVDDFVEDNLEITVIYPKNNQNENLKKIFNMTRGIWFGGVANGIGGGSRLFLCGNTSTNEQALVVWSALKNPLYFNENNYVYVGNKSHAVTAFGQQGEKLIIFKSNEIYYSYYDNNTSINADDLINQTVVDYESGSVVFPVILLHSTIGCDCPDTIQLCRNRLVWLNSKGRVYTLVSANQYSEMNVYFVSDMIENKIKTHSKDDLIKATSQDFDGHYMLIINSCAYLMDYNSYGYTHVYSYTKNEDANLLIPWYYWTLLPDEAVTYKKPCYGAVDGSIIALYFWRPTDSKCRTQYSILKSNNANFADSFMKFDDNNDAIIESKNICSTLQSKMFDFSLAAYLKSIDDIAVAFGNNGGVPISVTFVSNVGKSSHIIELLGNKTDSDDLTFIAVKRFYPKLSAVRTFGINICCNGPLVIDGITMKYRLMGRVK